eukprot:TRINITY_DN2693_c0_g1_i1.p1 TRINITY_DN2693_c0_g1~~TRINITY_DN2693_c0_g1_i1.p1  ORF type:complete len:413 (+),score=75.11 TRINITY_DN2693_c0_g1_i1:358-1596(+)
MGACTQPNNIAIVTELLKCDLHEFLRSREGMTLSKATRINMARGAAKGMAWLHDICNKIHRDLKPANLLVNNQHVIKVTDFGFTETLKGNSTKQDAYGPKGTRLWMAPEVLDQEEFDKSLDVYAFGLILWEIWTGKEPFNQYEEFEEFFVAVCIDHERPPLPQDAPTSFRVLLSSCWDADRKKRPTFAEVDFRLAEVLIDIDITDPHAATWWKTHFLLPTMELQEPSITILTRSVLDKETQMTGKNRCSNLKPFLVDEANPDVASRTKFSQAVSLFGHFYLPQYAPVIIPKMIAVKEAEWYWGSLSSSEANRVLAVADEGTFLIRVSTTHEDYPFALSFSNGTQNISHHRIGKRPLEDGGYSYFCGNLTADSLSELVELLVEEFDLIQPCTKEKPTSLQPDYQNDPLRKDRH